MLISMATTRIEILVKKAFFIFLMSNRKKTLEFRSARVNPRAPTSDAFLKAPVAKRSGPPRPFLGPFFDAERFAIANILASGVRCLSQNELGLLFSPDSYC